jgi:hypothetical protein
MEEEGPGLGIVEEALRLIGIAGGEGGKVGGLLDDFGVAHEDARVHVVAVRDAEVTVEAAAGGQVGRRASEVPLADAHGAVAGALEHVGEGRLVETEAIRVLREEDARDADARGVAAGQERGARRRTDGVRGAEIGEAHALGGHAVEVGGADARAVAAEIAVAEIVAEDEDDVGGPRRGGAERARGDGSRRGAEKASARHGPIIFGIIKASCARTP